ncbi:hypothetical protein ASE66_09530 [Bosea sp. Root483D1]|jgi:hypothetical protein|uniref:hypothetical protein n=1 Tax=Bosea sp. Root483D1 TaxID=1736544 RepID=UPI00070E75B8|nr:hypothetical protein [Bosea sp. Root483D1]KRE16006.1 hypothetical protein ASE66_09530 [Bosea sp. Root483D1]
MNPDHDLVPLEPVPREDAFATVRQDGRIDFDFYRAQARALRNQARSDLLRRGLRLPMAGLGLIALVASLVLLPATL